MASLISADALSWPSVPGECGSSGPEGVSAAQWATAKATAAGWLWALSGRRFGTWVVRFRPEWTVPAPRPCAPWFSPYAAVRPPVTAGNVAPLPGPVQEVSEVLLDGAVLDPSLYEVQGDRLVRIDGGTWPAFQDTTKPLTAAGTWQITYTRGAPVPPGGQAAAGVLACEIAAAMIPGGKCRLPANTQTVARNGVTVSMDAKQVQLGFTGLAVVDQWVRTVNPKLRPADPVVWSPDLDPALLPAIPTS